MMKALVSTVVKLINHKKIRGKAATTLCFSLFQNTQANTYSQVPNAISQDLWMLI